jgi:hypothetical protein
VCRIGCCVSLVSLAVFAQDKPRISVLVFNYGESLTHKKAQALTDCVLEELHRTGEHAVLAKGDGLKVPDTYYEQAKTAISDWVKTQLEPLAEGVECATLAELLGNASQ